LREQPDDDLRRTLINARVVTDESGRKRTELYSQQATDGVKAQGIAYWTKLQTGEISILWNGEGRKYNADLILVQTDGAHWIVEVKADDDARDPEVLAKREVAKRYVQRVNSSGVLSVKWRYVLVTETGIEQS
jgi:hypothetical protein